MNNTDIKKFHHAIAETEVAFFESTTKGLSIWESILLPEDDKGIVKGLIYRLKERIEKGENAQQNEILEKTVNNLTLIRECVLKDQRCQEAVKKVRDKILSQLASESLIIPEELN